MTVETQRPVRLKKVTLRYVPVEDRVRMDAQVEEGDSKVFWLTQRLCRELVSTVIQYFSQSGYSHTDTSPQNQGAVQKFLHQNARSTKKKAAPVRSSGTGKAYLLDKVRVRTTNKFVQLLIPLPDETPVTLVFSPDEARQWLDILYQQYVVADWPVGIWPEWIRSESGASSDKSVSASQRGPLH